jgi:uncharacterized protein with PCYCGC motif
MGRKSSAKTQAREATPQGPTPPQSGRSSTPLIATVIVAVVAVVGFAYVRNGRETPPAATDHSAHDQSTATTSSQPQWAKLGPHKQTSYPALPTQPFEPPRPPDVVRAAYMFAAEHPEILSYVPCFCGCERGGHKGNEDCFVSARDTKGDVTAWEPHGLDCAVCIDVATEARMMFNSGASVRDIRASVEKRFAGMNGGHTPTPQPPAGE